MKKIFELPCHHWLNLKLIFSNYSVISKIDEGDFKSDINRKNLTSYFNVFWTKYNIEISTFFLVFIVVYSQSLLNTSSGSNGNVEQWVNLTNQMFYGKQDFLFSYGPLYWLTGGATSPHNVYAYWLAIAFISVSNAFFWSIMFALSYKAHAYILFAIPYFLFFNNLVFPVSFFLWPFVIVAYIEFSEDKPLDLKDKIIFILGVLVGLFFYIRFMYGTIALVVFGTYFFSRFLKERKISVSLSFVIGTIIGYIVIGLLIFHNRISLTDYLIINSQLSFGNSVDMTYDVVNTKRGFVAVALIVVFLNIYLTIQNKYLLLTVNVLLLFLFKLGFSRTDHYMGYFVVPTAAVALVMLFDKSRLGRLLFIVVMVSLYYLSTVPVFPGAHTKNSLNPTVDFKIDYPIRMRNAYSTFKLNETVLNRIGNSSIDIYPYNNEYVFANSLNYQSRPLFQNYMTLTPTLDLMNKQFFESANRPRFILWTAGLTCGSTSCNPFDGFDQKFALNEDPLTSSAILLNYHIVEKFNGKNGIPIILLEVNNSVTIYSDTLISAQTMKFGEWYSVPKHSSGVVKLKPELNFTVLGRLKNMLFRGGVLKIKYKTFTNEVKEYRTNILNSESGIFVSPLLDSFEMNGLAVHSIMLETNSLNYFKPTFKSSWVSVPIPVIHSRSPVFDSEIDKPSYFKNMSQLHCDGNIDNVNGISPVTPKVHVSGGLRVSGWLALSAKDGITADKTFLTLTDEQRKTFYFAVRVQKRPDVVTAFKQPNLSETGYEALIDLSNLNGIYMLGLAGIHDTKIFSCSNFSIPLTISP